MYRHVRNYPHRPPPPRRPRPCPRHPPPKWRFSALGTFFRIRLSHPALVRFVFVTTNRAHWVLSTLVLVINIFSSLVLPRLPFLLIPPPTPLGCFEFHVFHVCEPTRQGLAARLADAQDEIRVCAFFFSRFFGTSRIFSCCRYQIPMTETRIMVLVDRSRLDFISLHA